MAGTRIGVIGCAGRMGRMLIADIVASEGCELAGGAAKPGSAAVGQDLGELAGVGRVGIAAAGDARQVLRDSDVAIDFTTPDVTASHAALAAQLGRPIVIGTTGLSGERPHASTVSSAASFFSSAAPSSTQSPCFSSHACRSSMARGNAILARLWKRPVIKSSALGIHRWWRAWQESNLRPAASKAAALSS